MKCSPRRGDLRREAAKNLRSEAAHGVFRNQLDPQHPWISGLETSSGCGRIGPLRHN